MRFHGVHRRGVLLAAVLAGALALEATADLPGPDSSWIDVIAEEP